MSESAVEEAPVERIAGDIFVDAARDLPPAATPKEYIAALGTRAPAPAPGGEWRYSNYGYVLLGRVVEVASGEPYFEYLGKHVFAPAGMTRTGPDGDTAVSWTRGEGGLDWPAMAAGTTLFLLPVLVFTVLLRKHLLRGVTFGAIRK